MLTHGKPSLYGVVQVAVGAIQIIMFKICSVSGVGKEVRMDYDEPVGRRFVLAQGKTDKGQSVHYIGQRRQLEMKRLLRVEGMAKISRIPDQIQMNFHLVATHENYAKAIEISGTDYENLEIAFIRAGLRKEDLKTSNLNIETQFESVNEGRTYRNIFKGYRMTLALYVEIPMDMDLLSKIIGEISTKAGMPEFSITFAVRDTKAGLSEALTGAVRDAKEKAQILAEASGVTLGSIAFINYHSNGSIISPTRMDMSILEAKSSMNLDLNPREVEMTQNVEVSWEVV